MYLGIDVGGTNLKAGVVEESGAIAARSSVPLRFENPERFAADLASLSKELLEKAGVSAGDLSYIGIGIPGAVLGGDVLYTCNIPLRNVPLEALFRRHLDLPVLLENDANCAAVGEWLFGAGRGTKSFAAVTLGTGVGGGLIVNGRLLSGGSVGELGHMVVEVDGELCGCGRRGCLEAYASATGLIRETRKAMDQNPESLMHEVARVNGAVDGRTSFQAALRGDEAAGEVCRRYVKYLAAGVTNLVNLLQPEAVAIGGGVSDAPEELLLRPLREQVEEECFPRQIGMLPRIVRAELGNDAGILGAALLKKAL